MCHTNKCGLKIFQISRGMFVHLSVYVSFCPKNCAILCLPPFLYISLSLLAHFSIPLVRFSAPACGILCRPCLSIFFNPTIREPVTGKITARETRWGRGTHLPQPCCEFCNFWVGVTLLSLNHGPMRSTKTQKHSRESYYLITRSTYNNHIQGVPKNETQVLLNSSATKNRIFK